MKSIDIFPWNDNFNTDIEIIDEQHKKLVQLLNSLASHIAFNSDLPEMNHIFEELIDYTVYHFSTEEKIWNQTLAGDDLDGHHKQGHQHFIEEVLSLKEQLEVTPTELLVEQTLLLLTRWLALHILESDRYMAMVVLSVEDGNSIDDAKLYADEQMKGSTRTLINVILSIYEQLSSNSLKLMREVAEHKRLKNSLLESEETFKLFLNHAPAALAMFDNEMNYIMVSERWKTDYHLTDVDLIGHSYYEIFTDTPESWKELHQRALKGEVISDNKDYLTLQDGTSLWLSWEVRPWVNNGNGIQGVIIFSEDITEQARSQQKLLASEARLHEAQSYANIGYWDLYTNGRAEWSEEIFQMFGLPDDFEPSCERLCQFVHEDDCAAVIDSLQQSLELGIEHHKEYRINRVDTGEQRWIECRGKAIYNAEDRIEKLSGFIQDITERTESEHQLRIAATVFESQQGMIVTDADNNILKVNKAFCDITGYSAEEVIGRNPRVLSSGRQDAVFYKELWAHLQNTGQWQGEILNRRRNGQVFPEQLVITAVKNQHNVVTNYVATFSDITVSKAAADEIKSLAFYDPLTNLPNRRLMHDRIHQALLFSIRGEFEGALLFIDLDNFKVLNDTRGHDMGDLLLQQASIRLEASVRQDDTVARFGGDEFIVMLEHLSADKEEAVHQIESVAEKIISSLSKPYQLGELEYSITPSIGATLFEKNEGGVDALLKQADIAMYQAKKAGRNNLKFFDPQMQKMIIEHAQLEKALIEAIEQQQFELYYQIQVDKDGKPLGAEGLIRWHHPKEGLIPPAKFIPFAEESGLIIPIGQWVLETACQRLKAWEKDPALSEITLAVNISAKQFHQANFAEIVIQTLTSSGIQPNRLKLELTESLLLEDIEDTIDTMNTLKGYGIQFSLDDFGTGYSSLQYLKRLPIYQLKIDQSFTRDLVEDIDDEAIVRTIIAMANSLRLEVIAEGVETEAQKNSLLKLNCGQFQGYLFGKPIPLGEFEGLVTEISKRGG